MSEDRPKHRLLELRNAKRARANTRLRASRPVASNRYPALVYPFSGDEIMRIRSKQLPVIDYIYPATEGAHHGS